MPDYIGNIPVPEIAPSGTFPIVPDYPHGRAQQPQVAVHQFGSGNAKIEQRFLLGTGEKRFLVRKARLRESERIALRNFWESKYGPYGAFYYNAPNDDGQGTTQYVCRFATEPLSWEMLGAAICSVGITLVEIPQSSPSYTLNQTATRFPPEALKQALLSQVQEIIPLVKIVPKQPDYPAIYVSDRRCTIGGQLYLARLLDWDGISQTITGESDEARFTFGNADRVMRALANDVDLFRATIEFSLFHVGTGIKLDLWKGEIVDWSFDSGPEFEVRAADGLYELNLPYPTRRISRTCWKEFKGPACPYQGPHESCDKGYSTPNGCVSHGMQRYFGGIVAQPQGVRIKDNSTGVWGFGRSLITSVSIVADSIYDEVVPEIYTDSDMPVNAKIAAGRDESDFYNALAIVGEGPIGAYGPGHMLDGQYHHGYPGPLGLREVLGNDPAGENEYFSLGQNYEQIYAAGTAFIEIRRADAKGLQLSRLGEHQVQAVVRQGLKGWVWTAPGQRSLQVLTNPIWIAVNMLLRARGLRHADAATCEQFFDVEAAIAAAAICDEQVEKLVGSGYETQFKFRGVIQEEKPLLDWIQEVLMNCLGYYTFAFGKLKLGVRVNSSAIEAFTEGNILFGSLQLAPLRPAFNHLTANFADEDYQFVNNSLTLYDIEHAKLIGGAGPLFLKSTVNLCGTASKSQAARIITTRLREELGGITPEEWKAARQIAFKTTVLALNLEPGMVCSMTHPDMPNGSGEFRVTSWRLNRDYSIDIQGRTTTDSMYDLVVGPKPADVVPEPPPTEPGRDNSVPEAPVFGVEPLAADSELRLVGLSFSTGENTHTITAATFTIYYCDGFQPATGALADAINDQQTTITVDDGAKFATGKYYQVNGEILLVTAISGRELTVERAKLNSAAASHNSGSLLWLLHSKLETCNFPYNFFNTSAAGSWQRTVTIPGARVAAVSCYVTNAFGHSETTVNCYTNTENLGLCLYAGGALQFEIDGVVGVQNDAAPHIELPEPRLVRDVYATVATAPMGGHLVCVVNLDGHPYATLTIPDGETTSNIVNGWEAGHIPSGAELSLDITAVGDTFPGERLVVRIRT